MKTGRRFSLESLSKTGAQRLAEARPGDAASCSIGMAARSRRSPRSKLEGVLMMTAHQLLLSVASVAATLIFVSHTAHAGAPTEELRGHVDQVIKILQRSDLQGDGKTTERRMAVRKAANDIFDFQETAKRSLGRHWQARTPAEREEFTRLFADLLEHAYIAKIDRYSGENVNYVGESVDGDQATVRTKLLTKQGSEVPVDYRLLREGAQWRGGEGGIPGGGPSTP